MKSQLLVSWNGRELKTSFLLFLLDPRSDLLLLKLRSKSVTRRGEEVVQQPRKKVKTATAARARADRAAKRAAVKVAVEPTVNSNVAEAGTPPVEQDDAATVIASKTGNGKQRALRSGSGSDVVSVSRLVREMTKFGMDSDSMFYSLLNSQVNIRTVEVDRQSSIFSDSTEVYNEPVAGPSRPLPLDLSLAINIDEERHFKLSCTYLASPSLYIFACRQNCKKGIYESRDTSNT